MPRWGRGCLAGCGVLALVAVLAGFWVQRTLFGPPPPAPAVPAAVALRPTFVLRDGGSQQAGTTVAVRLQPGSAPILITALHLLGPAGGMERNLPPAGIDRVVAAVKLSTISGAPAGTARGALRRSGPALSDDNENTSLDLAAFRLPDPGRVSPLTLAARNPGAGEWVWIAGDVVDHEPQTQRLFPARVVFAAPDGGLARLTIGVNLQAFSGAPLINARGEVAGLLIGGNESGFIATFNPAGAIRSRLAADGITK